MHMWGWGETVLFGGWRGIINVNSYMSDCWVGYVALQIPYPATVGLGFSFQGSNKSTVSSCYDKRNLRLTGANGTGSWNSRDNQAPLDMRRLL